MYIITQTPRLIIREFSPNEENTYLAHFLDEEVAQYLPKRSRDERTAIFQNALAQYAMSHKMGTWGMFDKTTGEFIGSCLLRLFNNEPGIVELGYSMERKYWGIGLGTEMALAMVKHSFDDKNTEAMAAVTIIENIASQRVLEKAGFKKMDNLVRDGLELSYFRMEKSGDTKVT